MQDASRWTPVSPGAPGRYSFAIEEIDPTCHYQSQGSVYSCDTGPQSESVCASTASVDCLETVWVRDAGGTRNGVLSRDLGRVGSVWTFPGVRHAFGESFFVRGLSDSLSTLVIAPVESVTDDFVGAGDDSGGAVGATVGYVRCVARPSVRECLRRADFPTGLRFGMTVRIKDVGLSYGIGRLDDPTLSFVKSEAFSSLSIEGAPAQVPIVGLAVDWGSLPAGVQGWFSRCVEYRLNGCTNSGARAEWLANPSVQTGSFRGRTVSGPGLGYGGTALEELRASVRDSAVSMSTFWFVSMHRPNGVYDHSCLYLAEGFTGMVATNALLFSAMPPAYDPTDGSLVMDVAGPHFEPDGTSVVRGSYSLLLRQDVADCFYGLDKSFAAPEGAYSEESVYTDGNDYSLDELGAVEQGETTEPSEQEVQQELLGAPDADGSDTAGRDRLDGPDVLATARVKVVRTVGSRKTVEYPNVTTRTENGWFGLSAGGFSFSSPSLRSRLSVVPSVVTWCTKAGKVFRVPGVRTGCPAGMRRARVSYCASAGRVTAVVSPAPRCTGGASKVSRLDCARGDSLKPVFAVSPRCGRGYRPLTAVVCVNTRNKSARTVRAVSPRCTNGFVKARAITCVRGTKRFRVTAARPSCPKGSRRA